MALEPGANPVTRAQVSGWITSWRKSPSNMTIQDFIRLQVTKLNLLDPMVNTSAEGRDEFNNETHIADLIIADLPSYGVKV